MSAAIHLSDSEEIQQEHVLPPGVGRSEAAHPDAAAVSSPTAAPTLKLTEDLALALLERRDLPPETLEQLGKDPAALRSRKVCVALAAHPRTPRHLALRLLRHFLHWRSYAVWVEAVRRG